MPEPIGHDSIIEALKGGLAPVSIFIGEPSVGKWTTAQWVRETMELAGGDYMEVRFLDADSARAMRTFLQSAPYGAVRLGVLYLGQASAWAQNMLLKVLEELPETSHAIVVTEDRTILPTLKSRGELFVFRRLKTEDVATILRSRNFHENAAERLAASSGGQVSVALKFASLNEEKIGVLGAVNAIRNKDAKTLSSFANRWTDAHTKSLDILCRETITGQHVLFEKEDAEALGRRTALKIIAATRTEIRPRLVVHAQLMGVLRGS